VENPEGIPKKVTDSELEIAQARLSNVAEDPAETTEGMRRKAAYETGRSEEARRMTESAISKANDAVKELAVLRKERDDAIVAAKLAHDKEEKIRDAYVSQMALNKASADRAMQEALDKQRNEFLKTMGYALVALGAICVVVGLIIAYSKFKTADIGSAVSVAIFGAGGGVFFFVCAWTINQWWFKWVVIGGGALGLVAIVVFFLNEKADSDKMKLRKKEADEAESTLVKIQSVLDQLPRTDPVFASLSAKLDTTNKALLNELKAESQRK
jgi:uncharacterized protein YhaN